MPVRFRCPHCARLLGIASRKIGTQINCPQCAVPLIVPSPDEPNDRLNLDELDDLVNPAAGNGPAPQPATATKTAPKPPPPRPKHKPGEEPLFEEDVDEILGLKKPGEKLNLDDDPPGANGKAKKPVSGMDAMSLDDAEGRLVLSPRKATLLLVAVVLLIGTAFAAGFVIASR